MASPFGETEDFELSRGIAQGAVESPWLYSAFINAIADELKAEGLGIQIAGKRTPLLMYADDIVLLAGSVTELRRMNEVISNFARQNRYRHNGSKSAVMVFNANPTLHKRVNEEPWTLSGEAVKVKKRYKYLGVDVLENTKDWSTYLTRAMTKARSVSADLAWACRRDKGIRPRSAATLWQAIVRPVLEYAAELWAGDIPTKLCGEVENVQTDFARTILGLDGTHGVSNDFLRAEMGMERIQARWTKLRLGYFRRLHVAKADRTIVDVLRLRKMHHAWGGDWASNNWVTTTHRLLQDHRLLPY